MNTIKIREKIKQFRKCEISIISLILVVISILTICAVFITAFFSVNKADDFANAVTIREFEEEVNSHLLASLLFVKHIYLNWQGTYTGMLLQSLLSPLNIGGWGLLRIVMVMNVLLFIFAFIIFEKEICKYFKIFKWQQVTVIAISLIALFTFIEWQEVFSWFTGAVVYCFPLSFGLIGITIAMKMKSKLEMLLSIIFVFLAVGGSLEISGMICFILVGICVLLKMNGRQNYSHYVVLFFSILGALINSLAPGNYARHDVIDASGIHFASALVGTVCQCINDFEKLLINTPFVILLCITFLLGIEEGKKMEINKLQLRYLQFFLFLIPFVTCYPVILGYTYGGGDLPNRCMFVEYFAFILSSMFFILIEGIILSDIFQVLNLKKFIYFMSILAFVIVVNLNDNWNFTNSFTYKVWDSVARNVYQEYYQDVLNVYDYIENAEEEDVFVYNLPSNRLFGNSQVAFDENPEDWVNVAIAKYFRKKSVQYVPDFLVRQGDKSTILRISKDILEIENGFVSIFDVNTITNQVTAITVLTSVDGNKMYNLLNTGNGRVGIYVYSDSQGENNILSVDLAY